MLYNILQISSLFCSNQIHLPVGSYFYVVLLLVMLFKNLINYLMIIGKLGFA